jgi:hypothetical protein
VFFARSEVVLFTDCIHPEITPIFSRSASNLVLVARWFSLTVAIAVAI